METKKENTANRNELAALEKQMRVNNAENIINQRKDFEAYFSGLYDSLNTQYNSEKNHAKSGKIKMLERFINEINEALYKYKNNSNVNVNNEDYKIEALQSLRNNFEMLLTDLHTPDKTQSKGSKKKYKTKEKKPKQLKDFLINSNNFNDKEIEKIEKQLLKHFKNSIVKDLNKGKKQKFNYLILLLAERNFIDIDFDATDLVGYFKMLFNGKSTKEELDLDCANYNKLIRDFKENPTKAINKNSKPYKDILPNMESFEKENEILFVRFKNG
ncbi:hypothetical protein [Psychroflexus planctonicus]|nr:hypothetical protein [Psychroflexus planctonicus]